MSEPLTHECMKCGRKYPDIGSCCPRCYGGKLVPIIDLSSEIVTEPNSGLKFKVSGGFDRSTGKLNFTAEPLFSIGKDGEGNPYFFKRE